MQLKGMYVEAAGIEDYDTCRGLCRIFTEMAESYILLIIGTYRYIESEQDDVGDNF